MKHEKHNPDYKLVSVTINSKELVYGETNEGGNPGFEVYYYRENSNHFHYSRRYENPRFIPMMYDFVYLKLKSLIGKVAAGHKLELTKDEYKTLANGGKL